MRALHGSTGLKRAAAFSLALGVCAAIPVLAQGADRATKAASKKSRADDIAEQEALKAKEEREGRTPTVVEEKQREKVDTAAAPVLKYEDFGKRKIELKVAQKRKDLIDFLDQILSQNPPDDEKPELLFQKAELYLEESQFHFFEGMSLEDRIVAQEAEGKGKDAAALKKKKASELEQSKTWAKDAILIYQEIEEKYPKFERMPEVLYALGRAFWDQNAFKKALQVYRKLIKDHPKSQYVADSWLAFGEFYFEVGEKEDRDVNKALNAYIEASKFEDNPIFGYAVYKQGWCYYNINQHDKAAEKFKEVVLYSDLNSDLLGARRITLAREARKDFVLAYSHFGAARAAPKEFESIAPDEAERKKMLERLGDIYYGDGKDRDAIIIYRVLMQMDPENTRNPLFQGKIVKLASRIGEKRQVVAQARELSKEYTRVRAIFAKLKEGDPDYERVREDLEAADDVSDNTLRFLATTWHNEAKKTRDDSTFEYAYELYGDYLELFSDRKDAYEIRFFYAELLYKLEKFEQAGEQYIKVFTTDPQGKWAAASAEEAVRAYDEVVQDFDRQNKAEPATGPDALKPRPIPDVKKKYIGACNNYIKNYPAGAIIIEARYKVARTLYDYNYFDDSTPRFMEIVTQHAVHPRAEQSANLVLDTFNILEDWQKLHDAAREFQKNTALMKNEEFKNTLLQVLEESSFKLINDYEQRKEFEEAAKRYLAFADEFSQSSLADKALANAAAMFTRAGQLDRAIKVRIKLIEAFPKSPLVPDQIFSVATSYEQIVDYQRAADYLEKFVAEYGDDPRAQDAIYNASIYRQGVGQTEKAIEDRKLFLKKFPKAKDVEQIAFSIPVAWDRVGKDDKAIEEYLAFAREYRKRAPAQALIAQYKAVRLLEKNKKRKRDYETESDVMVKQARAYTQANLPPEEAGEALGFLSFQEAEGVFAKFKELKITKPDNPKEFRKTLDAKRAAKDKVYEAYTKVVKLKSPEWAVASLYQIGLADQELVVAINAVPAPKGLTEDQEQLFKDKLTEQTLPLEEQAIQAMVLCLDESARFAVFNTWTRKCLAYLEERRPDTYPKNDLEIRSPVVVKVRTPEHGEGLVFDLPRRGQRAKPAAGTEPPAPTPSTEALVVASEKKPDEAPKEDDFSFDEGEI
jgi:tetratricopeptide (TPR) repeat protein